MDAPKTLQQAVIFYSDFENCKADMVESRWPDGIVRCPQCGSDAVSYLEGERVWRCHQKHARRKFSLKTGTIFEDSPLGLDKWLPVMWLLVNSKNGVSSWEIHRSIGVTQKTAWFMLQRGRLAMQGQNAGKLGGEVEVEHHEKEEKHNDSRRFLINDIPIGKCTNHSTKRCGAISKQVEH